MGPETEQCIVGDQQATRTEVFVSAATLLDKTTLWTLFLPIAKIDSLFSQAGYAGLEWMPLRD